MKLVASGRTHVGRKREHNEDQLLVGDSLSLYVVCDGMGGHKAGDIASALAIKSIDNFFAATADNFEDPQPEGLKNLRSARRLRAAVEKSNRDVHQISSHYPQHKGMGSTVVGFCVDEKEKLLHVAHVGDSRCYRLRDGALEQLTRDHSLVNDVRALQNKGANVKLANPPKNVITRALGMKATVEVDLRTEQIREGDIYILCSDGLTGMVTDEQMAEVFLIEEGVEGACDILIDMANEAGGTDNITVIIVKIEGELCSKCSAVMIEGSAFCGHCGQRAG